MADSEGEEVVLTVTDVSCVPEVGCCTYCELLTRRFYSQSWGLVTHERVPILSPSPPLRSSQRTTWNTRHQCHVEMGPPKNRDPDSPFSQKYEDPLVKWGPPVWQTIITGISGPTVWLAISPRVYMADLH